MRAYLDNSATTKPCEEAIDAALFSMNEAFYNPSAAYAPAIPIIREMEDCRNALLGALGARGNVVFTSGGTEADFIAIAGAMNRKSANTAVCSAVEHPAALNCAKNHPHALIPVNGKAEIDLDDFRKVIRRADHPGVVSVMQVNNETGTVYPVSNMAQIVKENSDALFHSDGVQGFFHIESPEMSGIDLFSISGHKIHALKGIGALYIADGVRLGQVSFGGGQEGGIRSGTENTPGIFSLHAAVKLGLHSGRMMENKLRLYRGIMEIYPDAAVNGPQPEDAAPHILNISFPGILAEVLLHALEGDGVYVSTASACAARQNHPSHVLEAMGLGSDRIKSAIRFSLSRYTSADEIDYALSCLKEHLPILAKFKRR